MLDSMLSAAKLDSLFSVIVDRKYLIPSVCLDPNDSRFAPSRSNEIAANHISMLASGPGEGLQDSRLVLHSLALGH